MSDIEISFVYYTDCCWCGKSINDEDIITLGCNCYKQDRRCYWCEKCVEECPHKVTLCEGCGNCYVCIDYCYEFNRCCDSCLCKNCAPRNWCKNCGFSKCDKCFGKGKDKLCERCIIKFS